MKRYSNHTMALWSNNTFPTLEEDWKESSQGKATKSSTKHQSERGGIQRPDRSVTPGATTTIHGTERNLR